MKTLKETLKSVIDYAKIDCDDLIGTLFVMGFTPRQLIYEFGFDKDTVLEHPDFRAVADACGEYNEGAEVFPFILIEYNPLEAAIVSRYHLSHKQMEDFLETEEFEDLKYAYEERIVEVEINLFNEILDEFEDATLLKLGEITDEVLNDNKEEK